MAEEGEIVGGWPEMNEDRWPEVIGGGIAREMAKKTSTTTVLFSDAAIALDYFSSFFLQMGG